VVLVVLGGAGALGALALAGWGLRRLRRRPVPAPTPSCWALAELDRLEGLKLAEAGRVDAYHTRLSEIVRRYLELRFQLRAPRQTTEEFLAAAPQAGVLSAEQQVLLREFLGRCDLAKFGRAAFSPAECHALGGMARDFVTATAEAAPAPAGSQGPRDGPPAG
jgi:hypothetical protein